MLLTRTLAAIPWPADEPNKMAGRAIAYGTPAGREVPLHLALAAEVGIRGGGVRVHDRHVHDARDPGPGRRVEQRLAVDDGRFPGGGTVREPHPVGAVEGVRAG